MMATYKIQIDGVVRDATSAEVAQIEARHAEADAEADAAEAKQVARLALLDRLGLTEQEAQLLLGS
jgi:hypothetical protein